MPRFVPPKLGVLTRDVPEYRLVKGDKVQLVKSAGEGISGWRVVFTCKADGKQRGGFPKACEIKCE
jgi:hypothetical protein